MKLVTSLLLLVLVTAVGVPSSLAAKPAPKQIPVVATYFSNLTPRAGQRETVTAQFYLLYLPKKSPHYLSGAHLAVTLELGKKVLMTVKGGTTDRKGKATAHFVVPAKAKGKWLSALTKVSYKGKVYGGSNRVKVATK